MTAKPLDIALVVGELSGDQLGFKLMRALREATGGAVTFRGTAGPAMIAEGMQSLFPLEDIAVMGFGPVIRRFPTLYRRGMEVVNSLVADPPDLLVIIDSPDFTHAVAKRVRKRRPEVPIVDYVSPSVWAWRPGRAKRMRPYVDHLLALWPFEPEAHRRLGGPPCSYVGHPLTERLGELTASPEEEQARNRERPTLVVLPGSRRPEIERLGPIFGEAITLAARDLPPFELVLPAAPRQIARIREAVASWPIKPTIVEGEAAKYGVFRSARAALAASGTVTFELALARVPMVGAYKVSGWEYQLAKRLVKTKYALPPNIILDEPAVPELIQLACTPDRIAQALVPLMQESPTRAAQLHAFDRVIDAVRINGETPSMRAARIILATLAEARAGARAALTSLSGA
ncbi:MAG: lipid-A-disaccharide synthase [Labrys sp. (in: a-proteobacteria)]